MSLTCPDQRDLVRKSARTSIWLQLAAGLRECVVVVVMYVGYTTSRLLASRDGTAAARRAIHIESVERALHLDPEVAMNTWASGHRVFEVASSYWYSTAHYLVTATVLVWLWIRHREGYRRARNMLTAVTIAALTVYITLPVAPPRLLAGFTDTLADTASAGWWSGHASAPRGLGGVTNELAAMPSMHVGWAVWVAIVVVRNLHSRWRHLVWLYPLITTVVVICSANHWLADAVAGALIVLAVAAVDRCVALMQPPAPPVSRTPDGAPGDVTGGSGDGAAGAAPGVVVRATRRGPAWLSRIRSVSSTSRPTGGSSASSPASPGT